MKTTTTTSTTFSLPPISIECVPNMDNPLFKNDPDRAVGIFAALNYLEKKGVDCTMEYGDFYSIIYT